MFGLESVVRCYTETQNTVNVQIFQWEWSTYGHIRNNLKLGPAWPVFPLTFNDRIVVLPFPHLSYCPVNQSLSAAAAGH